MAKNRGQVAERFEPVRTHHYLEDIMLKGFRMIEGDEARIFNDTLIGLRGRLH